jgi:hypothetical protein
MKKVWAKRHTLVLLLQPRQEALKLDLAQGLEDVRRLDRLLAGAQRVLVGVRGQVADEDGRGAVQRQQGVLLYLRVGRQHALGQPLDHGARECQVLQKPSKFSSEQAEPQRDYWGGERGVQTVDIHLC